MTEVKMKAVDTMHISNVGPDNLNAGDTFSVSESDAKQLEDRGLAKRVGATKAEAPAAKAADAPANKLVSAPANKALKSAPKNK